MNIYPSNKSVYRTLSLNVEELKSIIADVSLVAEKMNDCRSSSINTRKLSSVLKLLDRLNEAFIIMNTVKRDFR